MLARLQIRIILQVSYECDLKIWQRNFSEWHGARANLTVTSIKGKVRIRVRIRIKMIRETQIRYTGWDSYRL